MLFLLSVSVFLSANENYNNKSTDCQHCSWANTALLTGIYSTVEANTALRPPLIRPRDVQYKLHIVYHSRYVITCVIIELETCPQMQLLDGSS